MLEGGRLGRSIEPGGRAGNPTGYEQGPAFVRRQLAGLCLVGVGLGEARHEPAPRTDKACDQPVGAVFVQGCREPRSRLRSDGAVVIGPDFALQPFCGTAGPMIDAHIDHQRTQARIADLGVAGVLHIAFFVYLDGLRPGQRLDVVGSRRAAAPGTLSIQCDPIFCRSTGVGGVIGIGTALGAQDGIDNFVDGQLHITFILVSWKLRGHRRVAEDKLETVAETEQTGDAGATRQGQQYGETARWADKYFDEAAIGVDRAGHRDLAKLAGQYRQEHRPVAARQGDERGTWPGPRSRLCGGRGRE